MGFWDKVRRAHSRAVTPPETRALATTQALSGVGDSDARAWEKRLRKAAGGDARYTREGIAIAARAPVDHAAIEQHARENGVSHDAHEEESRLNLASIHSIPETQVSRRTRAWLAESAARGEDTYAYPPLSADPRRERWNFWRAGRRVPVEEFDQATGGTIDAAQDARRLGPGNSGGR